MATKTIHVSDVGDVTLSKRKGSRHVRIRIHPDGSIKVTQPTWLPYRAGEQFVKSKIDWIQSQRTVAPPMQHGDTIAGGAYTILIRYSSKITAPKTRVTGQELIVSVPFGADIGSAKIQTLIEKAALRLIKQEATKLLLPRLRVLANEHGFTYRQARVRTMKSRWGSCTSKKDICLNVYLIQLDSIYIDYVILHELVHTKILKHGPEFWDELRKYVPEVDRIRKEMKQFEPRVLPA